MVVLASSTGLHMYAKAHADYIKMCIFEIVMLFSGTREKGKIKKYLYIMNIFACKEIPEIRRLQPYLRLFCYLII